MSKKRRGAKRSKHNGTVNHKIVVMREQMDAHWNAMFLSPRRKGRSDGSLMQTARQRKFSK